MLEKFIEYTSVFVVHFFSYFKLYHFQLFPESSQNKPALRGNSVLSPYSSSSLCFFIVDLVYVLRFCASLSSKYF